MSPAHLKEHADTYLDRQSNAAAMQDVAVCCNVLQGVAVCCSILGAPGRARRQIFGDNRAKLGFACYSVLQCVAACCSVLQCVAVCCSYTWKVV